MIRSCLLSLLVVGGLASGAGADVITVGPAGDFTDIQPAVNAATDGDVILIASGSYGPVTVLDKAVSLVGDTGAVVGIVGDVSVQVLAASRTVVLSGLDAESTQTDVPGLTLIDNLGSVRVASCTFQGRRHIFNKGSRGALVSGCADVSFRDCSLLGGAQLIDGSGGPLPAAPAGAVVEDSVVSFHGGSIVGGEGARPSATDTGGDGGPGLVVDDTTAFASGLAITGGLGGTGGDCIPGGFVATGGAGGAGVTIQGVVAVFRDQLSVLTGGTGGDGSFPDQFWCPSGGPAGSDGPDLLDPSGARVVVPGIPHGMDAPTPVREQTSFTASLVGQSGDLVAVLVSLEPDVSYQPSAHGPLLLSPMFNLRILGTVPGSGTLDLVTAFPNLGPGVESVQLFTQPLFVDTQGFVTLGSPFTVVALDSAF